MTSNMEKLLKRSGYPAGMGTPKRTLELNPKHDLVGRLRELIDREQDLPLLKEYAELLYAQALIAEGSPAPNPARLVSQLTDLMLRAAASEILPV